MLKRDSSNAIGAEIARIPQVLGTSFLLLFLSLGILAADQMPAVQYHPGPFVASLGPDATLQVLRGFFFLDQNDAVAWARSVKQFNPEQVVGAIRPVWVPQGHPDYYISFRWEQEGFTNKPSINVVYQYLKHGYYPMEIMTSSASVRSTDIKFKGYVIQPEYDQNKNTLLFATRQSYDNLTWEILTAVVYGRHGKLVAEFTIRDGSVSVKNYSGVFRSILQDVSFKPGDKYTDYRLADPVAQPTAVPVPIQDKTPQ